MIDRKIETAAHGRVKQHCFTRPWAGEAALLHPDWTSRAYCKTLLPFNIERLYRLITKYAAFLEKRKGAWGKEENFFSREKKFSFVPHTLPLYFD